MGLDAEGQRGVGALEDTGTKNKRDGKCPVNTELTISMQRASPLLSRLLQVSTVTTDSGLCNITVCFYWTGFVPHFCLRREKKMPHKEQSFLNPARPSGGRMLRLQTGHRRQEHDGKSHMTPLTPNLVLLEFSSCFFLPAVTECVVLV